MKAKKEANWYDKIFKENIEAVTPALVKKVLGIHVAQTEKLQTDLPRTLERRPDELLRVTDQAGHIFVLQLEFQLADESRMADRMLEYYALLRRRYQLPIRQYVFFLADVQPQMTTRIEEEKLSFGFDLIWLAQVDYSVFLSSSRPDEVVFAVLGNFGHDSPQTAATRIVERLSETSGGALNLGKYLEQLRVLANLRQLKPFVTQIMESISKYIKPEEDFLFKQGVEQGVEKGLEKGIELEKREVIIRLLNKQTFTNEQIAEIAAAPVWLVESIRREIAAG